MKCQSSALFVLVACVALGCDSGETNAPSGNIATQSDKPNDPLAVHHPKYPDINIDVRTANAGGATSIWDEYKDGYRLGSPSGEITSGGQRVKADYLYDGTTDAGDKYRFKVMINSEEPVIKELTYSGEQTEIDLGDGMKIVAKPGT